MLFKAERSLVDDVHVVTLTGRLGGATSDEFERVVAGLFGRPAERALIDMTALTYIASAGMRVILMCAKRSHATQGRLVLFGLQPGVLELFEMTGLSKLLEVVPDRASALRAVSRG